MRKDQLLDYFHLRIHDLRQKDNYKASKFELDMNIKIAEAYQNECLECKNKLEAVKLRQQLKQLEPEKQKEDSGWFGGLFK